MTLPVVAMKGRRAWPPRASDFTKTFWDNLAERRFTTVKCDACGKLTFPPKPFCPHCWSKAVSWVELSGQGRLYSRTTVHAAPAVFAPLAPYSVAIVDAAEGFRFATAVLDDTRPDRPVDVVMLSYEDGPLFAVRGRP